MRSILLHAVSLVACLWTSSANAGPLGLFSGPGGCPSCQGGQCPLPPPADAPKTVNVDVPVTVEVATPPAERENVIEKEPVVTVFPTWSLTVTRLTATDDASLRIAVGVNAQPR